jgi:hypothetical protein
MGLSKSRYTSVYNFSFHMASFMAIL